MLRYQELIKKLEKIKESGWVKTHRTGPTGIGKTLEDLLGIRENNVPGPNAHMIELKSARKNAKSMLTLFTKSPLPEKANSVLLQRFGYESRDNEKLDLHTTVNALKYNTLRGKIGFKVVIGEDRVKLVCEKMKFLKEVLGYWDRETLKSSFEHKLHQLLFVKADSRGSGKNEEFWFNEAWLLGGFSFGNFIKLLKSGNIIVDIRIGQYADGRPHDHGTGFRVQLNKLDLCFENRENVM